MAPTVVSMVTHDQRRAIRRMQKHLDLDAPIETPRLDVLGHGGHRIGEPAPRREARRSNPSRPIADTPRRPRDRVGNGQSHTTAKNVKSIYVANLPWDATEDDVRGLFARHGRVHQTTIIMDKRTGRSKGFGFVDMPVQRARAAIKELHGSRMGGRELTVRLAQPRRYGG